ncbi:MAG: hypothetical protein RH862_00085 [Leptospiraceae bacterium]
MEPPMVSTISSASSILETRMQLGGQELKFITMLTTFGSPLTSAVQKLLTEALFPANAETEDFCLALDPPDTLFKDSHSALYQKHS